MDTHFTNHQTMNLNDYVTSIVSVIVKPTYLKEYEKWIERMNHQASKSTGFFSVDVIKPKDHIQPEYVVILKFDSYENLKNWLNSDACKKLTNEAKNYQIHMTKNQQAQGMEVWFSRPDNQRFYPRPKYYKQVLMGLMVVYPLSTVIGLMLFPYINTLPSSISTFIIIAIMSCLMTWPVMPYLTRWLNSWLYPKPKRYEPELVDE